MLHTDAWYPIRVTCNNCPDNPESGGGSRAVRTYNQASTVRKFSGHKMYVTGNEDQGWSWKELEQLNQSPTYQKDGLKLMASFISHSDNKPPQQRLACDNVTVDTSSNPPRVSCDQSRMVVQDVGATFGSGGNSPATALRRIEPPPAGAANPVWKRSAQQRRASHRSVRRWCIRASRQRMVSVTQ